MRFSGLRFTNSILLVLVLVLTISGLYGLFWTDSTWMFALHRAGSWGLIALLPWKIAIIIRSLQRRNRGKKEGQVDIFWISVSIFLSILTAIVILLALFWKGRFGPVEYPLRQTAVSWHWMLALGLLFPFALHVWSRWHKPRRIDFLSRRSLIRFGLVSPLATLGYFSYLWTARGREMPQEPVRFTGSRRAGWFSGNAFPLTHNQAPEPEQITLENWRLEVVTGRSESRYLYAYEEIAGLPITELDATIDCTLGWYARQTWRGVLLVDLFSHAGIERTPVDIQLTSVTGYNHLLPWSEAQQIVFATHVGGELLSAGHGYPLRAVVPTRRGWFWVKWLSRIEIF